jgi:hypothetical protein
MQRTCQQCGSVSNTNSRFCTNCGAVLEQAQASRQSWEAPPAQNQSQVPPWAQAQGGMYQQQVGMSNQNSGGSLGFGGQGDAQAKNLMKIALFVILGAFLLLIVCIALAIVIPISSIRLFFIIIAVLLILIPWIIFNRIRRIVRRTMGGFWRFM